MWVIVVNLAMLTPLRSYAESAGEGLNAPDMGLLMFIADSLSNEDEWVTAYDMNVLPSEPEQTEDVNTGQQGEEIETPEEQMEVAR